MLFLFVDQSISIASFIEEKLPNVLMRERQE